MKIRQSLEWISDNYLNENLPITWMNSGQLLESKMMAMPTDSYDIDIEADDIDLVDTVTVVWEIK